MTFIQMEALTGWAANDEWDFEYLGMTTNPFIKANYVIVVSADIPIIDKFHAWNFELLYL